MTSKAAPPRLAEWLVTRVTPRGDAGFVLADLREVFDDRVALAGARAAYRWYWLETARSIGPLIARRWQTARGARHMPTQGDPMLVSLAADARHTLRLARRSPLASLAVVTTMALGIGATTAVFSAMNAILLRPLPFAESSRVVQLTGVMRDGQVIDGVAYPDLMDLRHDVSEFSDLSVFRESFATLQHSADPRMLHRVEIDEAYPRVFSISLALGRPFGPADMVVGAGKVALLSYDFWSGEFGGDRSLVGKTITLDDEQIQVVGVLAPHAYTYPSPDADLVIPLVIQPNTPMTNRGSMWASSAAKLRPGASVEQARRSVETIANRISVEFPLSNSRIGARTIPLHEAVVGSVQSMLQLLAAAVAAVLLVACLNIANLILGRAQMRSHEFAVRAALGGSPRRVRRQVLTEGLVLAAIGGMIGAALSPVLTRALIAVYPDALPRAGEIGIDGRVLAIAALATIAAGLLSALPTARRAATLNLTNDLRDSGRTASGRGDRRVGSVLIVAQVAASLALLFSAGLLLRTFSRLEQVSPGFDARNTTSFHVFASSARYRSAADVARYYARTTEALRQIPGVAEVSSGTLLPFGGGRFYDVWIQEDRGDQGTNNPASAVATIDPGFERALGVPLLRGRSFAASDDSASEHVVVINDVIAKRNYPGVDPIGRLINWNGQAHWRIVGVVGTVRVDKLWEDPMPILYTPATQAPRRSRYFIIRAGIPSEQILSAARGALRAIDPTVALTDAATMEQRISKSLGPQRFRAVLMVALGALALGLAIIGIYGVVAYAVTSRTREIGIRMALGEGTGNVRRRVIGDALGVASIGIAIGVGLSLAVGKWLTVFLVNASPYDAGLLAAAAGILIAVVTMAAYGPARRAARVDPMTALRGD